MSSGSYKIPTEMEAWVGAGTSSNTVVSMEESEEQQVSAGASP